MRKTTQHEIDSARAALAGLCAAIASLGSAAEVERFLGELCTPAECVDFAKRWLLVKDLLRGKTQRAVARDCGMSLCKITRGARYVRDPGSLLAECARAALESEKQDEK